MAEHVWRRRVARGLRRAPWLMAVAHRLWRLGRPRFSVGVVGVVVDDGGRVLMVEHVFHPVKPWGLPGGWVERHEDPRDTLRRELREELALDVDVGPVVAVDTVEGRHVDMAYLCTPRGTVGTLSYELLRYAWFAPDTLPPTREFHALAVRAGLSMLPLVARV